MRKSVARSWQASRSQAYKRAGPAPVIKSGRGAPVGLDCAVWAGTACHRDRLVACGLAMNVHASLTIAT